MSKPSSLVKGELWPYSPILLGVLLLGTKTIDLGTVLYSKILWGKRPHKKKTSN